MGETDNSETRTREGEVISPPTDPQGILISQTTSGDLAGGTRQPISEETAHGAQIVNGLLLTLLICIFVLLIFSVINSLQKGTSGVVLGGLLLAAVISYLLWKIPKLQVSSMNTLSADVKFTLENEARKTLAQILGGIFLLVGIYGTLRSMQLSERAQFVGRFDKAVDQLANEKQQIRIGGVFALISVSEGSDEDKQAVREIFLQHIREVDGREEQPQENSKPATAPSPNDNSNLSPSENNQKVEKHRREIQLIIDFFADSSYGLGGIDLSNTNLKGIDFNNCTCSHWNFSGTHLNGASFNNSSLKEASFAGADLSLVNFARASMDGVNFDGADLREANLSSGAFGLKSEQIEKARNYNFAKLPETIVSELKARHPNITWPIQ